LALHIDWEHGLSPLNDYVQDIEPGADLLDDLFAKLDMHTTLPENENKPDINPSLRQKNVVDIDSMRIKIKRWRTAGATAIAAGLAAFIVAYTDIFPQEQPFVAVFHADDKQPSLIMSINIKTQQLTVRSITAEEQTGKTYQFWIKADEFGPTPRSLGLLTSIVSPIQKELDFEPAIIRKATFGISLEPAGGSPTGVPTGPAIHGKLYPTSI
jgi:anti-sigma-K factor RskA